MSDGPFKNLKLNRRWKRFVEVVKNPAFDRAICYALASDALVREILTDGVKALVADLLAFASQEQLVIDPLSSVDSIFNAHMKTPFADTLQKEVAFCLSQEVTPIGAVQQALEAAVTEQTHEARNRIVEECICAQEVGKMSQAQFFQTVSQVDAIFDSLNTNEVCGALLAGNKSAFKNAVAKKVDLDEGPSL